MNRRLLSGAALGVAAVLFLAINIYSQATLRQSRLDLTADRLFTLSEGTRNILAGLNEPITLKLFFSEKLAAASPQFRVYGQRVRELIEEMANRSRGRLRLQVIDPEPFSDTEDRAVAAGLQGVPLDQASGQTGYFGLVGTNSTDHQEVISFFSQDREPFLEYDIVKLVYALTDPRKPVVGILSDMDLTYGPGGMMAAMQGQSRPYAFLRQLRQSFDVRVLKTDLTAIDADVTVLVVIRPRQLPDPALYAIDQYLVAGGRAVLYVDPNAEGITEQPNQPVGSRVAGLPRLFNAWGLDLDEHHFVADPQLAVRVTVGEGARRRTVPYPAWLTLTPDTFNREDVVTATLSNLMVGSVGALSKRPNAAITFTALITSTPQARLLDVGLLDSEKEPEALMAALGSDHATQVLAARITGLLKTAFPDGPPAPPPAPAAKGSEVAKTKPLTVTSQPANLIVVADTDLLEDRFWVQEQNFLGQRVLVPFSGNVDFLVNAIDNLTGSNDLISLRSRAGVARPFLLVDSMNRTASEKFLARERALRKKLEQVQRQVADLQEKAKPGGAAVLSAEERAAIERFRAEALATRKELRNVQHSLNRDIERLAATLKIINIGLMPLLVTGFAIGLAAWRVRRRNRLIHD